MENVYQLNERFLSLGDKVEELQAELDAEYDENGGEITEDTELKEKSKAELEELRHSILQEIIDNADPYAEMALNAKAKREAAQAELESLKKSCERAIKKAQAYVEKFRRREDYWKDNFMLAMQAQDLDKLGGKKSNLKHSVWFKDSESWDVQCDVTAGFLNQAAELQKTLPAYIKVTLDIMKKGFDETPADEIPEGVSKKSKRTVIIR